MISDFDAFQAATIVQKTSRTGLLSNKRVLAVKSGVLYYYSNVPKDFRANDAGSLANVKEAPKCSIEIRFLTGISQDPKKPSEITIKFAANHAIEREEFKLRTSLISTEQLNLSNGKNTEIVAWTFKYQNQQQARWWLISLEQLKAHYEKNNDDETLERFLESFNAEKKKANTARRQSEKIDSLLKGSSSNNQASHFRNSELPQGLNGIAEEEEHQQQEEEITRELKLRQEKLKQKMEQKYKKEMEARIAEESREKQRLLVEKEAERQRIEAEKLAAIEQKERMLKKVEEELNAKLEYELMMIKKMEEEKRQRLEEQRRLQQEERQRKLDEERQLRQLDTQRRLEQLREKERSSAANRERIREAEQQLKKPFESSVSQSQASFLLESSMGGDHQSFQTYFELQNGMFAQNMQERLQRQTQLMKFITITRLEACTLVQSIVDELELPKEQRRHRPIKNLYSNGKLEVELAFVLTTSININGKNEILYNQETFEAFEKKLKAYNELNNRVMQVLKKRQFFPLRVPLVFFIEYRGVGALVTMHDHIESGEPLSQLEQDMYQKQLHTLLPSASVDSFQTTPIDLLGQRIMVLNIVGNVPTQPHSELEFHVPILPREFIRYNSDITAASVKKAKSALSRYPGPFSHQKLECLNCVQFCLNVRKLYRAGQGELKDAELWRMVLNEDPSILGMMDNDLCRTCPQKGLIIEYLRAICGVEIGISTHWQPLDLKKIETAVPFPLVREYTFEQLEVVELSEGIQKYIKEGKERLIQLALSYQKAIYAIKPDLSAPYIINQLCARYREKAYEACIRQCELFLKSLSLTNTFRLRCYEMLLGCYRHQQNHEMFMTVFKETLEHVQFMFGEVGYVIKLYCLLGQYLKSRGKAQEALGIYEEAVRVAKRLENRDEEVSLYIDMNNIHLESINLNDAKNILQFTLAELQGKSDGPEITAKLQQHLAKLHHLAGEDEVALSRQARAIEFYEANPKKYLVELLEGYSLQLRLVSVQNEKLVASKMVQLSLTVGDSKPIARVVEFVLARLIRKLSSKALTDLTVAVKGLEAEGLPSQEEFMTRITKRSAASDKNIVDSTTNTYLSFLTNRSDSTSKDFTQIVKLVGKETLLTLVGSLMPEVAPSQSV